jgi:putative salt-induced outer membrane protein YdiY
MTRSFQTTAAASCLTLILTSLARPAVAQTPAQPAPPPPPPGWTGSFGAGLALTQGNSDTSTANIAYDVKRDTGSRFLFKSTGLYIRGESEGELTTHRTALDVRGDRRLTDRTSIFAQVQYLRDEFKEIDYLISPGAGLSHYLAKNDRTELAVDAGLGLVWEKNPGLDLETDGAVTAGQNLKFKLTDTSEFTERVSALWKMDDFNDGLYIVGLGMAASVTTQTQIKVEFLNTFKNQPPSADVQKNDIAFLLSFVYKF